MLYSYVMSAEEGMGCELKYGIASGYNALHAKVVPYLTIIHVDPSPGIPTERPIFARYAAACDRSPVNTTAFKMRAALVDTWSPFGTDMKVTCPLCIPWSVVWLARKPHIHCIAAGMRLQHLSRRT